MEEILKKTKRTVRRRPRVPKGYIRYTHDNFAYNLPEPYGTCQACFAELELCFSAENKFETLDTKHDRHSFVSIHTGTDYHISITLYGVREMEESDFCKPIMVSIYRKRQIMPIFVDEIISDGSIYELEIPSVNLTPGDYFIVINGAEADKEPELEMENIAGMSSYHFSVLEHGSRLIHPVLTEELVEDKPVMYLNDFANMLKAGDEYRYTCYNSSYRRLYSFTSEVDHGQLTIQMMDPCYPVDDVYTIVLSHNNEPFKTFKYTLLDKQVHHLTVMYLSPDMPVYQLATTIERHLDGYVFGTEPGFGPVKEYILNVLAGTEERGNLMVVCEDAPSRDFINTAMELLHGPECYETIHALTLIEKWRTQGKDCLKALLSCEAIYLERIDMLLHVDHMDLLEALDMYMEKSEQTFYLFGTTEMMKALLDRLPYSQATFEPEHRLLIPDFEPADLVYIVDKCLSSAGYDLDDDSLVQLNEMICNDEEYYSRLDRQAWEDWSTQKLVPYLNRKYKPEEDECEARFRIVGIDFDSIPKPEQSGNAFEKCMAELNAMVGLEPLKERLVTLFNRTKFDRMRLSMGLPGLNENRQHMIFTGNPGTGKTTVARIMGKVFKELGVLSVGNVITAERSDMVGKYIGHTEDTMKELLQKAKGNVLFVDEAYSLCDGTRDDRTDYGYRAIECLLGILADNDSDIIVIMAGYEKEMKQMLEKNPGLRGRFPYVFNFEDYTSEQLLQISLNRLHEKKFNVSESVKDTMLSCIRRTVAEKDTNFHNARWAEQFVMQGIISAMADRLCQMSGMVGLSDLCNVTEADVTAGYEMTRPVKSAKGRNIGFRVA